MELLESHLARLDKVHVGEIARGEMDGKLIVAPGLSLHSL